MENNKKNLKILSIAILALVAIGVIFSIVTVCIKGFPTVNAKDLPEGISEDIGKVLAIVAWAVSLVLYLPQLFLGLRGLKVANGTSTGKKGHIVWGVILAICAIISVISANATIVKTFNVDNLLNVISYVLRAVIYVWYVICAVKIAKA